MIRIMSLLGRNPISGTVAMLLLGLLASGSVVATLTAQSVPAKAANPAAPHRSTRFQPDHFAGRAGKYYAMVWGVDSLSVKAAESGELIRFTFRVLDALKAKPLNDKTIEPSLFQPEAHIQLVIPSLEKVGQLRQSGAPEVGKSYWMAFSNPRRTVRRGDRVNVVIGQFHADGLVVE